MSAFTLQLKDARADFGIRNISGVCQNGAQTADYVNRATRQLMKRGCWFGTQVLMQLCSNSGDIVFPRHVGTVLGLRFCGSNYTEIRNNWWAIMKQNCGPFGWDANAIDVDMVPTFNQVSGNTGKLIRWQVVNSEDYGKKLTLFGKKYGGQPLQEQVSGVTQNGLTLTAQAPLTQTTDLITSISSIVLEPCVGPSYVYEYDPATTLLRMLAFFEPGETNPRYRRMRVPNMCCKPFSTDENGVNTWRFEALVKLTYVPVVHDDDFLLIDDLDALAMAIQAIKAGEANDFQLAEAHFARAIRELNFEDRNKSPDEQLSIRVQVNGPNYCLQSLY